MGTLLIYAIEVGIAFLIGLVMYKISKHDTDVMNKEIDRIKREDSDSEIK